MPLRQQLKRLACSLARPFCGGIGCILALHRVTAEGSRLADNRALELTPAALRALLAWVQQRGLEVIRMDEVPARLAQPRGGKFIAFTFDDGYRDNLTAALPIFREFGFPFTVNLTTGFLNRTASVWWYALEDSLTPHLAESIRAQDRTRRDALVTSLCAAADVDPLARTHAMMLDWDEARTLAADPLVTIGAHTVGHHTLMHLSDAELRAELLDAKTEIEAQLARPVTHLAYPFGGRNAVGAREFAAARDFTTAVTTRSGNLFPAHAAHLHALPRFNLTPDADLERLESGLDGRRRVVVE
jgi:peptidoglycan/xylan/chitin deacetylase (PgdA/CDA1 family)